MKRAMIFLLSATCLVLEGVPAGGQSGSPAATEPAPLTESGQIAIDGHTTPYLIRHLPASSFPQLPAAVLNVLVQRNCLVPQTYEAHRPENVVQASLERRGSSDWAVLCSEHGTVSLLVFFGDKDATPRVLATAPETERLQPHGGNGALGFDWAIDAASPEQVHEAQAGMRRPPQKLDHDALADSIVDQKTIYHYFSGTTWTVVDTQD
jgi:hypothetical protein